MMPATFREFEHQRWESSVPAYDRFFGPLTQMTTGPLLDRIGVKQGTRLLDVATGPGYVAAAAAARGADVVAVDFSEEMIAHARAAFAGAAASGKRIRFETGDAENLAFADASFDAVAMNFGALHLSNPEKSFAEAFRVLRAGGGFGFTVWAPPSEAQGFAVMLASIEEAGDMSVPLPPGPPFFRFSERTECEGSLAEAGFAEITVEALPLRWQIDSAEELFQAFHEGTARTGGLLRAQTPEARAAIQTALRGRVEPYRRDGKLDFPMSAVLVAGRKPSA